MTRDPVYGGNDNPYAYPVDPINAFDLSGKWSSSTWYKIAKIASKLADWTGIAPGWMCGWCGVASIAASVVAAVGYFKSGHSTKGKNALLGAAAGVGLGAVSAALSTMLKHLKGPIEAVFGNRQGRDMYYEMRAWIRGGQFLTYLLGASMSARSIING